METRRGNASIRSTLISHAFTLNRGDIGWHRPLRHTGPNVSTENCESSRDSNTARELDRDQRLEPIFRGAGPSGSDYPPRVRLGGRRLCRAVSNTLSTDGLCLEVGLPDRFGVSRLCRLP
jgi:hypothetical protein